MSSTARGYYVCFDGDRIGEAIQLCLVSNDVSGAKALSDNLGSYVNEIIQTMASQEADLVFRGGDSLVFHCNTSLSDRQIPHIFPDITFSVGVGT